MTKRRTAVSPQKDATGCFQADERGTAKYLLIGRLLCMSHWIPLRMLGGVADSRDVRGVVTTILPSRHGAGFVVRVWQLVRHDQRRDLHHLPNLVSRTQPDRLPVRRGPHAHAVVVCPFKHRQRSVGLATDEKQLACLVCGERQADAVFGQPIQEISRAVRLQPRLRNGRS